MSWGYKGNKYGNHKVTVDGITFDSKHEATRYLELKALEKAGKISLLERQKRFVLIPSQYEPDTIGPRGGKRKGKLLEHECCYVADFVYYDEEAKDFVVEDAKGYRTPEYVIKRKLLLWLRGYQIREV